MPCELSCLLVVLCQVGLSTLGASYFPRGVRRRRCRDTRAGWFIPESCSLVLFPLATVAGSLHLPNSWWLTEHTTTRRFSPNRNSASNIDTNNRMDSAVSLVRVTLGTRMGTTLEFTHEWRWCLFLSCVPSSGLTLPQDTAERVLGGKCLSGGGSGRHREAAPSPPLHAMLRAKNPEQPLNRGTWIKVHRKSTDA